MKVWPRKFIGPRHESVITHNYQCLFLACVARRAPEAVDYLVRHVLPSYKKHFWGDCERKEVANVAWDNSKYHEKVAQAWCRGLRDNWQWDFYGEVRDPLLRWAESYSLRDYSLRVEWVLQRALDALLFWS